MLASYRRPAWLLYTVRARICGAGELLAKDGDFRSAEAGSASRVEGAGRADRERAFPCSDAETTPLLVRNMVVRGAPFASSLFRGSTEKRLTCEHSTRRATRAEEGHWAVQGLCAQVVLGRLSH
jgi:hypothetical protein